MIVLQYLFFLFLMSCVLVAVNALAADSGNTSPEPHEYNRNALQRLPGESVRTCRLRISGMYPSLTYQEAARVCTITE
jgi:hypothetical protein